MTHKNQTNVPLEQAKREYMETLVRNGMAPLAETVAVAEAAGRTTARAVYARICVPDRCASAMDGAALDAGSTLGAGEGAPVSLAGGQYAWVGTGDPIPEGFDAVVMSEDIGGAARRGVAGSGAEADGSAGSGPAEKGSAGSGSLADGSAGSGAEADGSADGSAGSGAITLTKEAAPWQNIRRIGEDICAGEMILPSYSRITPSALGAMYAGGISEVPVIKRPVVGIIASGPVGGAAKTAAGEGPVTAPNAAMLSAMLRDWGAETVVYPIAGPSAGGEPAGLVSNPAASPVLNQASSQAVNPSAGPAAGSEPAEAREALSDALGAALLECDAVVLCAGTSAADEDSAAGALAQAGAILYSGLAIKPGRTAILGHCGRKPILGVPAYPVSGIIVVEQLLRPIVGHLLREAPAPYRYADAILSKPIVSSPDFKEFVRVRLGYVGERLIASPLGRGSGIVTSFMKADGVIEVPQGIEEYKRGGAVSVRLLREDEELRRSLVVVGSHDPLLDELADLLRMEPGGFSMCSAHVGSIGGLLAVRRGEAHLAGTHLLDEETGEYNVAFARKMLPKGGARLVECVKRTQGLMLPRGNPRGVRGFEDLARGGLRFVNRQKGSGTRVLTDYLCRENGMDSSMIRGYGREEFTHNSVAALVAAGSADAGMGIFSAAKLHGLDFVPVCLEQYDLLIPDHSWGLPKVQTLLRVMASEAFRWRLEALGGYVFERPGTVREEF